MSESASLNVVHLTFGLDVGGLEKLLVEFARYTDRERHRLTFVSLGDNGPVGEDLRRAGCPVVCMHRGQGFRPGLIPQLKRLFINTRADVVHTHDPRPLIYAAPAARLAGVKSIVHTQHGRVFGCSSRQLWMMRHAAKLVDSFACVSGDIRQLAIEHGIAAEKTVIVHNGLGSDRFEAADLEDFADAERDALLCVARLSPEKGVSTLIDAMAIAVGRLPSLKLLVAGHGPCRQLLDSQIRSRGLSQHVRLLGQVDNIPELFRNARVFVLPSNSEGISLTLLEAMLAKVPIIATNVGGTPEIITDRVTGLLVEPSKPDAMAKAIIELWEDRDLQVEMVDAASELVDTSFSIDQMLQSYQMLYHSQRRAGAKRPVNQRTAPEIAPVPATLASSTPEPRRVEIG